MPEIKPNNAAKTSPVNKPVAVSGSGRPLVPTRVFRVTPNDEKGSGLRIGLYSKPGGGKTTLASLVKGCVFIDLDDSTRLIRDPRTGKPINTIGPVGEQGNRLVLTGPDVTAILKQPDAFPDKCTVVLDNLTLLESYLEKELARSKGKNAYRDLGWDGPPFLADRVREIFEDTKALARTGRNVILITQELDAKVSNAAGADYLKSGPQLLHQQGTGISLRTEFIQWSDHLFRIGFTNVVVEAGATGKKAGTIRTMDGESPERVIFTAGALNFEAKSRPVTPEFTLPQAVSFSSPTDDSLWAMLFYGARPDTN